MTVLNVGRSVECVYRKGQGSGCLANLDLTNPVYVADNTAVTTSSDQIPALGSIIVDGSRDIYASTQAATILQLQSMPGVTSWAPSPAQVAAQINAIGLATAANQAAQNNTAQATNTALVSGIALPVGAAKEAGNLLLAQELLAGTSPGALIANTGLTVGKEVAALIASGSATGTPGGAPLLHGFSILSGAPSNTFLGAGGSSVPTISNITRPGYVFTVYSQNSSGASTVPFVGVNFQWKDLASGLIVAEEQWYVGNPFSPPANQPYFAKGPTKANSLNITFKNFDPATNANIFWTFAQTTQHISRDDWRGPPMTNMPGWTATVCDPFALVLAAEGSVGSPLLIPASSAKTFLLPLYAGEVQFSLQQINAPQSLNITITSVDPTIGVNANGPLYLALATAATSISPIALNLPRTPCQISITNNSATTQAGIAFYMSVLEYAS